MQKLLKYIIKMLLKQNYSCSIYIYNIKYYMQKT